MRFLLISWKKISQHTFQGLSLSCELKHYPISCLSITALYLLNKQNMEKGKAIDFMKIMNLLADYTYQNTLRILKFV